MITRAVLLMAFPLALAACDAPADPATNTAAQADGDYVARVRALPEGQRDAVLFRAIRDAGHECQQVTASAAADTVGGNPAWTATCDDGSRWVVALDRNGLATVGNAAAR